MTPATDFDMHEALRAGVRDAAGAWRFVRRFATAWAEPIVTGDGYEESDLRAAEAHLGLGLPPAVREMYRLFGRRDDLTRVQDRLLAPDDLEVDDGVLVFRMENQAVTRWGVPVADLDRPDPPVVFLCDEPDRRWRPFLDRVSLAGIELVLSEWMFGAESLADNRQLDAEDVTTVERWFRRLPFPDYPMWPMADGPPVRWFAGTGVILRDDADDWLWVRAASPEPLDAVRRILPGEWIMS